MHTPHRRRFGAFIAFSLIAAFIASPATAEQPPSNASRPGIFVAVGYGGRRMSSRDGINWENVQQWVDKGADDSNNLISLAYGKGKFVAVGGGGWSRESQAGHVMVSTDGAAWREVKKMQFRISPIMFEAGRFIAGAPDRGLIWSEDGENWNEGLKVDVPKEVPGWAFWFRRGIAGNGIFVFTGNANKDQKTWWCITTRDGKSISSFAMDLPQVQDLAFGAGKFLMVAPDGIHTSLDGKSWIKEPASPADTLSNVVWTGKEFFLNGKQSSYTSADGLTWKPLGKPAPCRVIWSDGSLFLGTGWPGKMFSSTDGLKWTPCPHQPMPMLGVNSVAYGVPTK